MTARYTALLNVIKKVKPKRIVEFGAKNGLKAVMFATEAMKHHEKISYSLVHPAPECAPMLSGFADAHPGVEFLTGDLFEGEIDFAFIGGETLEDFKLSYEQIKDRCKVIAFDNFYLLGGDKQKPDTKVLGSNQLAKELGAVVFERGDHLKDGGYAHVACVGIGHPKQNLMIQTKNCVDHEVIHKNITHSLGLKLPEVPLCEAHDETAVMCSGGPSLMSYLPMLEKHRAQGNKIFCVKHAHDELIKRGIIPFACILLDPRGHVKDFIERPHPDVIYLVASMCSPSTFERLLEHNANILVYHAAVGAGEDKILPKGSNLIGGGPASAQRGLTLLHHMGFRRFELFGYDCCYWGSVDRTEKDKNGAGNKYVEIQIDDRIYLTDHERLAEVQFFEQQLLDQLRGSRWTVHGDGMIAAAYRRQTEHYKTRFNDFFNGIHT